MTSANDCAVETVSDSVPHFHPSLREGLLSPQAVGSISRGPTASLRNINGLLLGHPFEVPPKIGGPQFVEEPQLLASY